MTLKRGSPNLKIKQTGDGSDTLISEKFNQPYHSLSGAVAESRYVYFEANGLVDAITDNLDLTILEIGFGTGMNLILLLDYLEKKESRSTVNYCSVEAYPIDSETARKLNFGNDLKYLEFNSFLEGIFSNLKSGWNKITVTKQVTLHLFVGTFDEITFTSREQSNPESIQSDTADLTETFDGEKIITQPIDFILQDPFSPDSNPEGWNADLFSTIFDQSSENAMLTTYSAATAARAAMAVAGWFIARAPGALGKREMTVASKNPKKLLHLKRVNENRLIERYHDGDFD